MRGPDPFDLLADVPREWRGVAAELVARLGDPNRPWLTPRERQALDALLASRPYLVTNRYGARCRRCGAVHPYLTLACIERPFTGWTELFLLERQTGRAYALGDLEPISIERARRLIDRIRVRGYAIESPVDPSVAERIVRQAIERT